jgi:hypothetical protein
MTAERISWLDFADFTVNQKSLVYSLAGILQNSGACIIKNFPGSESDNSLIELSELMGKSVDEKRNINGKTIYNVEVNNNLEVPAYANTPYEFLCHSDCAEFPNPPDTVLLLCERQAETGGESYLIWLEDILSQLSIHEVQLLAEPVFPLGKQFIPILSTRNNRMIIRYNRVTIDINVKAYGLVLDNKVQALLDKLDQVIDSSKFIFKLEPHDCLIINNEILLHGRGAFPENSNRLLKRVRLYLNPQWLS